KPLEPRKRNGALRALRALTPPTRHCSIRRLVLREAGLELLHHRIGIEAGLAHLGGPARLQRLRRLAPLVELAGRDGVDLVARFGLELGVAAILELRPRAADLDRP